MMPKSLKPKPVETVPGFSWEDENWRLLWKAALLGAEWAQERGDPLTPSQVSILEMKRSWGNQSEMESK